MGYSYEEIEQYIEENDVKFIRLAFCDIYGELRNISILPQELSKALSDGIPFEASALKGFLHVAHTDLLLFPDIDTLTVLPWRPSHGRVVRFFCNIFYPDGTPFEGDGRRFLKNAVAQIKKLGYNCHIGTKSEFYLFKLDDNGNATDEPFDSAGYLDVAPLDKGENFRREICLTLEQMGIIPERSYHEHGPGQNEIDFKESGALKAADNFITFRNTVQTIAAQNGLYASFEPKPSGNLMGNSLHVNMSLTKKHENIFDISENSSEPNVAENFAAGVLRYIKDITFLLNPTNQSYRRLGKCEAPKYITWSHQVLHQLVRIPDYRADKRMELRSPDPECNPYFGFGMLIYAGIEGIKSNMRLPDAVDINIDDAGQEFKKSLDALPSTLDEAIETARMSEFVKRYMPEAVFNVYMG